MKLTNKKWGCNRWLPASAATRRAKDVVPALTQWRPHRLAPARPHPPVPRGSHQVLPAVTRSQDHTQAALCNAQGVTRSPKGCVPEDQPAYRMQLVVTPSQKSKGHPSQRPTCKMTKSPRTAVFTSSKEAEYAATSLSSSSRGGERGRPITFGEICI